jgi:hypothetical protein
MNRTYETKKTICRASRRENEPIKGLLLPEHILSRCVLYIRNPWGGSFCVTFATSSLAAIEGILKAVKDLEVFHDRWHPGEEKAL